MGANRKRLPLHPRPLPDEALSSWLVRLGRSYRLDLTTFLSRALGIANVGRGELNRHPPAALVQILSERTGVPSDRIRSMTLAGCYTPLLIDALYPRPGFFATYACQLGILAPARHRRSTVAHGLDETMWLPWIAPDLLDHEYPRACRRCLVEGDTPYTRLHWRAAWMASCPVHGEMLEFGYVDHSDPAWSYRGHPARPALPALAALDRLTLTAVTTGTVALPCGRTMHAGVWLRLLRALIDEMTRPASVLVSGAYVEVLRAWREAGDEDRKRLGRRVPYEAMKPEHRDQVLAAAATAVRLITEGARRWLSLRMKVSDCCAPRQCGAPRTCSRRSMQPIACVNA
jgi:hypothetical protein